ncbi:nicotinate-nucleotide adenylyltransferase [Rhodoblastus acidophilus]|uniref:Probable nicotinate-nucleotide adenylyltransferase n=1 Tax=Candidatus Rhodoblastus alkanivorans TaxID=2954117 RepID=A0ABS9Z6R7_9HYPH|nr:nicotinate-nucleotide adenylyltransferase [Candidatus Rhodoblastus alkanivorans]MCI4682327.1 nicotinate-nucleotide adenylyltransferase [Candidatus Rhodoblastus alkanivorans]MDI4639629.1 nicotinate-nucleotide adenylyltransferase [Rhodoblastus acidophilus]
MSLPPFARGMRIGLFGGSFNPPHAGHALVCELALKRLGLHRIWVMVSPGNPLKSRQGLPSLQERMAAARKIMRDPRFVVTGFEAEIGARYSFQTVDFLRRACPGVHFVWIMGADNLAGFFRWQRWRDIAHAMPILAIDRPGATHRAERGQAATWFARRRLPESQAKTLPLRRPPALIVLHGPRSPLSSTQLRAQKRR